MPHGWDNFFMMAGTAAATLVGLLFVALTLGANLSTPRGLYGTRTFLTPTLLHFAAVLYQCLLVLAPWPSAWPLGIVLGLCGSAGFVYQAYVIFMQRKLDFASPDWFDWLPPSLQDQRLITLQRIVSVPLYIRAAGQRKPVPKGTPY
jgi:hypothetical protein